jgi:MFS family permease
VTTSTYLLESPEQGGLGFSTAQVGWIYSTFALGGMIANSLVGLLADRLFPAQRVFAGAMAICTLLLFCAGYWCDLRQDVHRMAQPVSNEESLIHFEQIRSVTFFRLFWIMLAQCVALHVAMTLSTVISLRNLPDPSHDFSRVRLWGTVGWIVAGWLLGVVAQVRSAEPFFLASALAALTLICTILLPETPPRGQGKSLGEAFGLPAFVLFQDRSFVIFLAIAYIGALFNQFYGVYGHRLLADYQIPRPERWMTMAQFVEVAIMFLIPVLKPKQTMKWLMLAGLLGYVVRGVALMTGSPTLVMIFAVPMHGWSYALFFIVAATYIDREAPPHLRASAQAIVSFVASGLAPLSGNMIAASVVDQYRDGQTVDWQSVWLIPTVATSFACFIFACCFSPPPEHQRSR